MKDSVTIRSLRKWMNDGEPFAMLTCYDATTARLLWDAGIKIMLVGDTAAQMILGHDSTLPVDMDFMVQLTGGVKRGAPDSFVMADMPFGSYQISHEIAMANSIRFLKESGADSVKLEVDASHLPLVEKMCQNGIPITAHIGSRPQLVKSTGGYRSTGKNPREAKAIYDCARQMIVAGASLLLLEAVPADVGKDVAALGLEHNVPVIGCGAGPDCHGHVVVLQDLLGMTGWQPPFVTLVTDVGEQITKAAQNWQNLVKSGTYLKENHPYQSQ